MVLYWDSGHLLVCFLLPHRPELHRLQGKNFGVDHINGVLADFLDVLHQFFNPAGFVA
jgi:hypothetical protein